jgi:hypothetical protein
MTFEGYSPRSLVRCAYCRGMVPAEEFNCIRCGAPLPAVAAETDFQALPFDDFVLACHQKIAESGTSAAELAFGVGCTLAVLVGGMLMVLIFFLITKIWTVLVVILFILALISFLISTILATRAREATTRKTYERDIKPQVERYILNHGLTQEEFVEQAAEILPASSPLLTALAGEPSTN